MRLFLIITITLGKFLTTAHALKPTKEYLAYPSDYGIIYREFQTVTSDSVTIKGWFFPAQVTVGISNSFIGRMPVPKPYKTAARAYHTIDDQKKPTIIICDGDAGNMAYLLPYAYELLTRGFNVVLFDWRGFGQSDVWSMNSDQLCYTEFLLDYRAVIDYVKSQPEVDSNRIGVFGFSTGAYLSFAVAVECDDVAAYAGRALITSSAEVAPIIKL